MRKHPAAGMKAWWKSFRYKIVSIIMAVIFYAAMMIPASAIEIYPTYTPNYIYQIGQDGMIFVSEDVIRFQNIASGSINCYALSSSPYIVLCPLKFNDNNVIQYQMFYIDNNTKTDFIQYGNYSDGYRYNIRYDYSTYSSLLINQVGNPKNVIESSSAINIEEDTLSSYTGIVYIGGTDTNNYVINNNNNYNFVYNQGLSNLLTSLQSNDTLTSLKTAIVEAINSSTETIINTFESSITTVIVNQQTIIDGQETITDHIVEIITYGSNYNQIDSTLINNFGNAESKLSSAEGAVRNKSGSLKDSVSSQWSENTTKTRAFVNTIAPATAAITNTINSVVSVMPDEVQTMITVVALLLFIGWLLGRIGGG